MKKLLGALALVLALAPLSAFAQTDDQIRSNIVTQLLSVFVVQTNAIDKVNSLIATASDQGQFASFKTLLLQQSNETAIQLATLLNPSGVPIQPPATGGSGDTSFVPPTIGGTVPPMPQDQSAIIVKGADAGSDFYPNAYGRVHANPDASDGRPYGDNDWTVWVKDSSGNFVKGASVTMSIGPADDTWAPIKASAFDSANYYTRPTNNYSGCVRTDGTCIKNDWNAAFQYIPTAPGVKTITFTSGKLSQSVSVEVK